MRYHQQRKPTRATRGAVTFVLASLLAAHSAIAGKVPLDDDGGPSLTAKRVLVLDNKSGKALLARSANEVTSIASLTKLQAALVAMDRGLKLDQPTVITRDDWKVALKGCRTRLELKWAYKNRDLLHAALLASDNRAVSAFARAVGLHANALVQAMNERARREGLKKTTFRGPVGIDPGNVSTAWEVSRMVRAAARNGTLRGIMSKREYTVKPAKGYLKVLYRNTNPLVRNIKGAKIIATKTGYNSRAGYCLAVVAKVNGVGEVTIVLLGSRSKATRVRDERRVIQWLQSGGHRNAARQ